MAIANELAERLAELSEKPVTVAINHLRNLRDAGFITKAGRGASAAAMTIGDAVMLILAMAGTERLKDSADVAKVLSSLRCVGRSQIWQRKEYREPLSVLPLDDNHSLAEALHSLFEISAVAIGLETENVSKSGILWRVESSRVPDIRVSIVINYPTFSASISIELPRLVRENLSYGHLRKTAADPEFTRSCRFGRTTLDELNRLVLRS